MFGWLLLIILIIFAIYYPWFWIAVSIAAIWKGFQVYFYKGRPWRRIHFPVMRAYASAAGMEMGIAANESREFNILFAFQHLLRLVKPDWSETESDEFIKNELERLDKFADRDLIQSHIQNKRKNITDEALNEIMEIVSQTFSVAENELKVRMIIAGFVEEQYGTENRAEYLYEAMIGRAK